MHGGGTFPTISTSEGDFWPECRSYALAPHRHTCAGGSWMNSDSQKDFKGGLLVNSYPKFLLLLVLLDSLPLLLRLIRNLLTAQCFAAEVSGLAFSAGRTRGAAVSPP